MRSSTTRNNRDGTGYAPPSWDLARAETAPRRRDGRPTAARARTTPWPRREKRRATALPVPQAEPMARATDGGEEGKEANDGASLSGAGRNGSERPEDRDEEHA